ncbi:hypothetical protein [Amycolatopsis sp. NPDC004772]
MIGFAGGQVGFEPLEVAVDDVGAAREPGPGLHGLLPVALKNV